MKKKTTRIFLALAFSLIIFSFGSCKKDKTVAPAETIPIVSSTGIDEITETTAKGSGVISSDGGGEITAQGFCWGTNVNPDTTGYKTSNGTTGGNFSGSLNGLKPGTTYHLRAYATNSAGIGYGNDLTFTTLIDWAVLTTNAITNKTSSSCSSGGNITADGGSAITARGVCWSTTIDPSISDNKTSDGTGTGAYTSSLTGLNPGVTYHLRAYATNSRGTCYGSDVIFTTDISLPTLTTTAYSSLTGSSVVCGGIVSSDGGASVTMKGVCWSTAPGATISNSKTSNGMGTGSFISTINGLNPVTTYYARAFAINSAGTSYGNEISFTTPPGVPVLSTDFPQNVLSTSALVGGVINDKGGAEVTDRGFCWNTTDGNPTITDSKISLGAGGNSFPFLMTNLLKNTIYYVRAYAINSAGIGYGSIITFRTGG